MKPNDPQTGKMLRVVQWNIERGLEFDAVRFAFTDPKQFNALMEDKGSKASEDERAKIREQIVLLQQADLVVLNEVDLGVNRTLFRNVTDELASALNMNYAYAVEFVEVDPITMGLNQQVIVREVEETDADPHDDREAMLEHVKEVMKPDPERYHGMHGTAILTRYRLENVKLIPFLVQGHDWYKDEKKPSLAMKAEGKVSAAVFKEQLVRQVRRGGRMMLMADIADPELPSRRVTVVATHLEDVTSPEKRRKQLEEMLDKIEQIDHPVIIAGDMNTSTHTGVPFSVTRALKQRFGNGKWWAEQGATNAIKLATPLGWAYDLTLGLVVFARKVDDPTRTSIPLLGDNPEARFFSTLEKFRFDDGSTFDFRGDPEHSANGRGGRLANSNERSLKGFEATEELARRVGPIGQYKLDWIFVRPAHLAKPDGRDFSALSCFRGRTLSSINHALPERISDHNPILADLTLADVAVLRATSSSHCSPHPLESRWGTRSQPAFSSPRIGRRIGHLMGRSSIEIIALPSLRLTAGELTYHGEHPAIIEPALWGQPRVSGRRRPQQACDRTALKFTDPAYTRKKGVPFCSAAVSPNCFALDSALGR